MLVLTRKPGASIIITNIDTKEVIKIKVTHIKDYQGRSLQAGIGISAPDNYTIHREEIQNKIDLENGIDIEGNV